MKAKRSNQPRLRDLVDAAERSPEIDDIVRGIVAGEAAAKLRSDVAHQMSIRTREPVDALPVVAHCKEARMFILRRQGQEHPPAGDAAASR